MDQYNVEAVFCKGGSNCETKQVKGKWSPIYAQAMMVELDNGLRFVTNFRYNLKDEISKNPLKENVSSFSEISTGSEDDFNSQCDQTMIGFVQNKP